MKFLFSAALKKCGNFEDAEDLTSETLLAALKYPREIKDIKKWLSGVLNHKYYDMLRRKYKLPTVSINLSRIAECRKYSCYAFPMAVMKIAMEKGDFYNENCTPPMVMVIEE